MLNSPKLAIEIFNRVRESVQCPLTVKIRTAYSNRKDLDNFWQICDGLVEGGVDGIAIHGRAATQRFRYEADWEILTQIKKRYPNTTISGSGDIMKAQDIVDRIKQTGIDGIVVARGAIGNPWIFSEAKALLEGKTLPEPPSLAEQGQVMIDHFNGLLELYEARKTIGYFRKFAVNYAKRHNQKGQLRRELVAVKSKDEFYQAIKKWYHV